MRLLDRSLIERLEEEFGAKRHRKPNIAVLATDPRRMKERQRIQSWFNDIPEERKRDVKGRFVSAKEDQHFGAYNELIVHRFLQKNGMAHEFDPEVREGKPDFLVKASTNFYLEVISVFESPDLIKERENLETLWDELDEISDELDRIERCLYLSIMPYIIPDNLENLKYRDNIKIFLEQWMGSFDHLTLSETKEVTYDRGGLRLRLIITPGPSGKRGLKIVAMGSGCWSTAEQVSKALKKKIQKYKSIKQTRLPYVVALSLEDSNLSLEDVVQLLLGRETVGTDRSALQTGRTRRDNHGLLTPESGLEGKARYTRLSAVLVIRRRWFNDLTEHNFTVIHNPYACNPLSPEIFDKYAQLAVLEKSDEGIRMEWTKRRDEYKLL